VKKVTASAPGKIHLTGEHSVVHGKPALLAAIDIKVQTEITDSSGSKIHLCSNAGSWAYEFKEIKKYWRTARSAWNKSQKLNDDKILEDFRNDSKAKNQPIVLLIAIGQYFSKIEELPNSFSVKIESKIPIGCGLGSSASVATSLFLALDKYTGKTGLKDKPYLDRVNRNIYEIERIMHGKPSGGDNTAAVFGGIFWLQKKSDNEFSINHLDISKDVIPQFVLINSGPPSEPTGDMVDFVNDQIINHNKGSVIEDLSKISEEIISNFKQNIFKPELLTKNERLLEKLDVVGDAAKRIIRQIEQKGGYAKITGAGGREKGSGMILAYHDNYEKMINVAEENGCDYFTPNVGPII
jgi:mevalonate kinase